MEDGDRSLLSGALLAVPLWGSTTENRRNAVPGSLNSVEGEASIADQTLDSQAVGNVELQNGQVLETGRAKPRFCLRQGYISVSAATVRSR